MKAQIFNTGLVDTAEHHEELRKSVGRLASHYGRKYFQDVVARAEQPTELWEELGAAGFLGAHIPESYGGSGGGLAEL